MISYILSCFLSLNRKPPMKTGSADEEEEKKEKLVLFNYLLYIPYFIFVVYCYIFLLYIYAIVYIHILFITRCFSVVAPR